MSRPNEREIARKLSEREDFEPPAGLLEKIKAEIPAALPVRPQIPSVEARPPARQRWLVAASLVAAVGAGLIGLRTWDGRALHEEAPDRQSLAAERATRNGPPAAAAVPPAEAPKPAAPAPAASAERTMEKELKALGYVGTEGGRGEPLPPPPPPPPPAPQPLAGVERGMERGVEDGVAGGVPGGVVGGIEGGVQGRIEPAREADRASEEAAPALRERRENELRADAAPAPAAAGALAQTRDAVLSKATGEDGFVAAALDPFSSFRLIAGIPGEARAKRRQAAAPAAAGSVRVGEWVSSIDYGDPDPAGADFAVHAEGAPSTFARGPLYRLLRLNVKARGPLQAVARDASVEVEVNRAVVTHYRRIGAESGSLAADRGATVLYEVELRPDADRTLPVATVRLRYKVPGTGEVRREDSTVGFDDVAPSWREASPALRLSALVGELGEILSGSPQARRGDLAEVVRELQEVAPHFSDPRVAELVEEARKARGGG